MNNINRFIRVNISIFMDVMWKLFRFFYGEVRYLIFLISFPLLSCHVNPVIFLFLCFH